MTPWTARGPCQAGNGIPRNQHKSPDRSNQPPARLHHHPCPLFTSAKPRNTFRWCREPRRRQRHRSLQNQQWRTLMRRWDGWSPSWLVPDRARFVNKLNDSLPSGFGYSMGVNSAAGRVCSTLRSQCHQDMNDADIARVTHIHRQEHCQHWPDYPRWSHLLAVLLHIPQRPRLHALENEAREAGVQQARE